MSVTGGRVVADGTVLGQRTARDDVRRTIASPQEVTER
jgi:hypothetical protein